MLLHHLLPRPSFESGAPGAVSKDVVRVSVRVLVLAPALYNTSPGQRYRVEQWARYLESDGFEFTFAAFEDTALHALLYRPGAYVRKAALMLRAFGRRIALIRLVRRFDVVLLHREAALVGPAFIERLVTGRRVPVVFDFDDAIWVPYVSPANGRLSRLKCFGKTAAICRLSTHIIVGNRYLADYARQHNRNVTVVPSTIDTTIYSPRGWCEASVARSPLTIGWTGSHSTIQHLNTLGGVLRELRRRYDFRLHVIGAAGYRLDGFETHTTEWRPESEAEDLHRFDIGIMPVPDDAWSRGKCGMKLLQYMGAGVPAVASPVGANADIVRDGVNGFLAASPEQWIEKLSRLICDVRLRRVIAAEGRRTVENRFSVQRWLPTVRSVLELAAFRGGLPR